MNKKQLGLLSGLFLTGLGLVLIGLGLVHGSTLGVMARGYPLAGTELGEFYAEFHKSWTYVPDEENIWFVAPDHRGDCEDYALTFYFEYPREVAAWILIVRTPSSFLEEILGAPKYRSHALLVLWETGGFYVVDNGNVVYLEGSFASYDGAVDFYMGASGAVSAWSWYLPPKDRFSAEESLHALYMGEKYQILP